ncbi:MAG: thiamine-phosphate kinase [Gammaproteobacteria bacterium]|nr:thiamine-phosphate kinase [Gammaproteobacteria bacterium]
MAEFDLIARIAAQSGRRADVALGIGDDGAVLDVPAGQQLVAVCDTLNVGVHFAADADAADIGWKALAVNLSDLAAMGASPAWALMSLSLPQADPDFVAGLMRGFGQLAAASGIALVGGDTTRGPLAVGITALGFVPAGRALTRAGAQAGDAVFVSGTLGDAAAALRPGSGDTGQALRQRMQQRLHRPVPRTALGLALRGQAHAVIDVSDGLLADLGHVANASGVGIVLDAAALPASDALRSVADPALRLRCQASGGDDYELAFTLPESRIDRVRAALADKDVPLTCIGRVLEGGGVRLQDADGAAIELAVAGWDHFAEPTA